MLNVERLDVWFDAAIEMTGEPPSSGLMDPTILLPLSMVRGAVETESGYRVTTEALETMVSAGWFKLREAEGFGEGEPGVLLIVPNRVGWLLDLREEGWSDGELRTAAAYEQEMVEHIYTADDLSYVDSPQEQLVRECLDDVTMVKADMRRIDDGVGGFERVRRFLHGRGINVASPDDVPEAVERMRRMADVYRRMDWEALEDEKRRSLERIAFRIACRDEWIRMHMLQSDRDKARAGFSPFLSFTSVSWGPEEGFEGEGIWWESVVNNPWLLEQAEPRIRVPGVVLEGMQVRLTGSPSPSEYDRLYREYDLELYFEAWSEVVESRVCRHCFAPLPEDADPRRKYCGDGCRNAAKQKRYRERNPDAAFDNQVRYYSQFADDE